MATSASNNDNSNGEPTLGEIRRTVGRLENDFIRDVIPRAVYDERQKNIDGHFADTEKWQEQHQEGHKWLSRLLAGTALTMLVTLVVILIQVIGASQ